MADHKNWTCIDIAIATYFVGMTLSGLVGFFSPPIENEWDKLTGITFSWAMVGTGIGGIIASLARSRQGEFIAIMFMSFLTIVQGFTILDQGLQPAFRLLFAPFMMISFAAIRRGFNISKRDADSIKLRLRRGLQDE